MHELLAAANRFLPTVPPTAPRRRPARTVFAALSLALTGAALALAPGVLAQSAGPADGTADEAFGETIDVELVNVDVWVTDRRGEPVRNLPASAFTVRHNGDAVEATYFQELAPADLAVGGAPVGDSTAGDTAVGDTAAGDTAAGDTQAGDAEPAPDGNYLIIYLDQLRLEQRDYLPTLEALRALLEDPALVPEHVLMLRQDRGLFVESHLGSKRPELLDALGRLGGSNAAGLQAAAELDQALDQLREEWRISQELSGTIGNGLSLQPNAGGTGAGDGGARAALGGTGSFGPDACDLFVQRVGATVDGWARSQAQRTRISLEYLSRTATFLAGLPGVKTVLYVSGGLETEPGSALGDYVSGLCPGGEALFALDGLGEELGTTFFQLTRHLNSNRVTLYPFKTGALRPSSSASPAAPGTAGSVDSFRAQGTFEQRQRRQLETGLGVLADETGGRLMTTDDQIQALARRLATRYSLAYAPPETRGTEMRITVDVDAGVAGAQVRHRRSFLDKTPDQRLAELVDGALFLGLVENGLDLRLGAGELTATGDDWRLPLRIQVPVESLTFDPGAAVPTAELSVRVVARNLESGALETIERSFRVKQPEGQVAAGARAQLPIDLDLAAGPTSIAVGARDGASGVASVVSTALRVGDVEGAGGP